MTDYTKPDWQIRMEEHDRQMRIVWTNALAAVAIVLVVLALLP